MHNNSKALQEFQDVLASYRFKITMPINPDGQIHRLHDVGGKEGNLNGWYRYQDGPIPYAVFGNWRTGEIFRWYAGNPDKLTHAERKEARRVMAEAAQSAKVFQESRQYIASWRAQKIWAKSFPANTMHPYLVRKGVQSHGLRQRSDRLIIPFFANGQLTTLQFISPDGTKRWLYEGKKKAASYLIGIPGNIICIAEGYATGASIYQAKGYATFIAGDAGNLRWVAESIRYAFPQATIIICADNDDATLGNPGVKKAKEAAAAVGGLLAIAGDYNA